MQKASGLPQPAWPAFKRGVLGRCPACGKGRLFTGYLRQASACSACGEPTGDIRADDGPAWATVLLVGHIVSPGFLLFASPHAADTAWPFLLLATLVLGLTFLILPRAKGAFIGIIWATHAGESDHRDGRDATGEA